MTRFSQAFLFLFLPLTLALAGCGSYAGGQVFSSPVWKQDGGHAGKVFLIVASEQREGQESDSLVKDHTDAVTKINAWWNQTADWSPYKSQEELERSH